MRRYDDQAGDWQGLDSSKQVPRYAAIAEMLRKFSIDGNVLDVGCGEALLRGWLPQESDYTGIEPSATAVGGVLERDASSTIIHTTAEEFDPGPERYDCIVFNEVLYYAADPIGLLQKYAALIRPGGMILCSIYQKPGSVGLKKRLWHWLDRRRPLSNVHCAKMVRSFMVREGWPVLDDRAVTNSDSRSQWHIWLASPDV